MDQTKQFSDMDIREKFQQAKQSKFSDLYKVQLDVLYPGSITGTVTIIIRLKWLTSDDKGIYMRGEFFPWSKVENFSVLEK